MMTNRFQRLDLDLKKCYEYDLDWALLPPKLHQVRKKLQHTVLQLFFRCRIKISRFNFFPLTLEQICDVFGKGLKQQKTTILLGLLSLISFCLGHASVKVHDFWNEPIILWMAIVLPTGMWFKFRYKVKRLSIPSEQNQSKHKVRTVLFSSNSMGKNTKNNENAGST